MTTKANGELIQSIRALYCEVTERTLEGTDEAVASRDLIKDEGMDSLDLINLLFRIEEEVGVKIPEPDIDAHNLTVVGNLADYLAAKGA